MFGNKNIGRKHEIKLKVNVPRKKPTPIVLLKEKTKRFVSLLDFKGPKISFKTGRLLWENI